MSAFIQIDGRTINDRVADASAAFNILPTAILNVTGTGDIDQVPSVFHRQISKEIRS